MALFCLHLLDFSAVCPPVTGEGTLCAGGGHKHGLQWRPGARPQIGPVGLDQQRPKEPAAALLLCDSLAAEHHRCALHRGCCGIKRGQRASEARSQGARGGLKGSLNAGGVVGSDGVRGGVNPQRGSQGVQGVSRHRECCQIRGGQRGSEAGSQGSAGSEGGGV